MSESNVKKHIVNLFQEMNHEVQRIIASSASHESATQRITSYVAKKVTAASKGYVFDLYSELSEATLQEPLFQDAEKANKFYALNIMQRISDAYNFNINDLESFKTGFNIKEINRVYTSAAVAVGSAAVGGILLGALSGVIHIPMVVIIAGAVIAGIAGGGVTYAKIIPDYNKNAYSQKIQTFMTGLEKDMMSWVDEVVKFYNKKVEDLKKAL